MILRKHRQGVYLKDIAAELGCSERTVRRVIRRGGAASGRRPNARGSKLDPFKGVVDRMLSEGIYNAEVIFKALCEAGYAGGRTILQDYIRPKRALQPSKAKVRFETAPGRQMQHDWGELDVEIAGARARVHFAVNTLGYSRRMHLYAAPREDAAHTYESLVRAFEHFGGAPAEVLVDNQTCAVLGRTKDRPNFNPRFLDLAGHYGFTPRACRAYRAQTKGKTERMVGYVKDHFFQRYRRFESLEHLNRCLEAWLERDADTRVHGTHGEVVIERFEREERPALQALPRRRFDTAYRFQRIVAWDAYVHIGGQRYRVPEHFCGERVVCRETLDGQLIVYGRRGDGGADEPIAYHVLTDPAAGWQRAASHPSQLAGAASPVEVRDLRVYEEVVP